MTVRLARPSDLAVALPLWEALHREHEARDPRYRLSDDASARWSTDFRSWTRSGSDRVWLAVDGGEAVGLLTAHIYEPAPVFAPSTLIYVDDLYVAPAARRSGLAARLLGEARQWGVDVGATQLRAGVLAQNAAGLAFWHQEGATDFSVTVTIPIDPSAR